MKYRHVVARSTGGPEVLQVVEDELAPPADGQVLVKVLAADVGFSDVNIRRGRYPGGPRPPFTPGYAVVGVVEALGPGVTEPAVGQTVAALTFHGGYSQYVVLPAEELCPVPEGVDPAEAATVPLNYLSAHQMLHRLAHVGPGGRILVHGAAGGVGTAFLELGRVAGLEVFGTASKAKHDLVRQLGAEPVDYRAEDFVDRVATLTDGRGVDAAFDPMGAANLKRSAKTVRKGGSVVAYGYYAAAQQGRSAVLDVLSQYARLRLWSLPPQRKHAAFYDIRSTRSKHPDWYRDDLEHLFALLAARDIRPVVAARLPLVEAATAHRRIEQGEVLGRLVLIPNP